MSDHGHIHEVATHLTAFGALLALCIMLPPLGILMVARRMSLMGDALSHALLPGVVIAVIVGGSGSVSLTLGALSAGLIIALLSFLLKKQGIREEASLATVNILSMSLGAALLPLAGKDLHLEHLLFGSLLTLKPFDFWLLIAVAIGVILTLIVFFKRLVRDTVDPDFKKSALMPFLFFALMMVSLVASYQAAGTLLAVGLMLIPALVARVWGESLKAQIGIAVSAAVIASAIGFTIHEVTEIEPAPVILMVAGLIYLLSLLIKAREARSTKPHLKG